MVRSFLSRYSSLSASGESHRPPADTCAAQQHSSTSSTSSTARQWMRWVVPRRWSTMGFWLACPAPLSTSCSPEPASHWMILYSTVHCAETKEKEKDAQAAEKGWQYELRRNKKQEKILVVEGGRVFVPDDHRTQPANQRPGMPSCDCSNYVHQFQCRAAWLHCQNNQ